MEKLLAVSRREGKPPVGRPRRKRVGAPPVAPPEPDDGAGDAALSRFPDLCAELLRGLRLASHFGFGKRIN